MSSQSTKEPGILTWEHRLPQMMNCIIALNTCLRKSMHLSAKTICAALLLSSLQALAGEPSPVGRWTAYDDDTGEADAIIEIQRREDGTLYGWVDEILSQPKDGEPARCTECEGEIKDAPVLGLPIIRDMQREGGIWRGHIMDPKNGKVYNATMSMAKEGESLEVRGYIGIPLLGRSQTWGRVE